MSARQLRSSSDAAVGVGRKETSHSRSREAAES